MTVAREIMLAELPCNIVYGREQAVDGIIAALTSAGFRIVGPEEVDPVTEAMVEAVVQAVRPYTMQTLFIDEHRELVRDALKAGTEAGR